MENGGQFWGTKEKSHSTLQLSWFWSGLVLEFLPKVYVIFKNLNFSIITKDKRWGFIFCSDVRLKTKWSTLKVEFFPLTDPFLWSPLVRLTPVPTTRGRWLPSAPWWLPAFATISRKGEEAMEEGVGRGTSGREKETIQALLSGTQDRPQRPAQPQKAPGPESEAGVCRLESIDWTSGHDPWASFISHPWKKQEKAGKRKKQDRNTSLVLSRQQDSTHISLMCCSRERDPKKPQQQDNLQHFISS